MDPRYSRRDLLDDPFQVALPAAHPAGRAEGRRAEGPRGPALDHGRHPRPLPGDGPRRLHGGPASARTSGTGPATGRPPSPWWPPATEWPSSPRLALPSIPLEGMALRPLTGPQQPSRHLYAAIRGRRGPAPQPGPRAGGHPGDGRGSWRRAERPGSARDAPGLADQAAPVVVPGPLPDEGVLLELRGGQARAQVRGDRFGPGPQGGLREPDQLGQGLALGVEVGPGSPANPARARRPGACARPRRPTGPGDRSAAAPSRPPSRRCPAPPPRRAAGPPAASGPCPGPCRGGRGRRRPGAGGAWPGARSRPPWRSRWRPPARRGRSRP